MIKITSLYMLWSQYKLATIRRTEFLRKEITGILNIANQNSDFLTLQTSEFQKKSDRNLRNQTLNRNSAYDGGPRNRNQKLEFPTKHSTECNVIMILIISSSSGHIRSFSIQAPRHFILQLGMLRIILGGLGCRC